jgi:hypothetical protein
MNRIFAEVADFTKTMGKLHGDFLSIVQRDMARFVELTNDYTKQMNWQGWTTIALTGIGASLAVAGTFFPKNAANAATPPASPRLGAHNGITDGFSNMMKTITQKLSDNDFLRTTCKTSAKAFNGVNDAANSWFKSTQTKLESARSLIQSVNLQDGQAKKSTMDQQVQLAQQAISRLIDAKSKGAGG